MLESKCKGEGKEQKQSMLDKAKFVYAFGNEANTNLFDTDPETLE